VLHLSFICLCLWCYFVVASGPWFIPHLVHGDTVSFFSSRWWLSFLIRIKLPRIRITRSLRKKIWLLKLENVWRLEASSLLFIINWFSMDLGFKFVLPLEKAMIVVGDNLCTRASHVLQTSIDQKFVCSIFHCWGLHIFYTWQWFDGRNIWVSWMTLLVISLVLGTCQGTICSLQGTHTAEWWCWTMEGKPSCVLYLLLH